MVELAASVAVQAVKRFLFTQNILSWLNFFISFIAVKGNKSFFCYPAFLYRQSDEKEDIVLWSPLWVKDGT